MSSDELLESSEAPPRESLEVPPHDLQAERAVLGSILKNPRSIHQITDLLVPEAFYDRRHRVIYAAAVALVHQDVGVDYHTLGAELERLGAYERSGGLLYLSEINLATPSAAHIEHYGQIVADHFVRRQTIDAAQTIAERAWRAREPVDDILALSQSAILGLSDQAGVRVKGSTASEAVERWLESFNADRPMNELGDRIVGCSTGLRSLDKRWGRFRRKLGLNGARSAGRS